MNNFYASVECMLDPVLKKYPVAVCGSVEERHGIVLAKNYAAKAFGIKTGDAVWQAKQKCRNLVVVPPHFEEYIKYSKLARNVYQRYTDQVEPYGMDECWLDISGTDYTFGSPEKVANDIRETIKFELGLTISVGVSFNKIFAKLGSDMKKPDAVTVIPKDTFRDKIWGLPAADLLGVGRATQRVLDSYCIRTIGDLAKTDPDFLNRRLGKNGIALWQYANGNDRSRVMNADFVSPVKSVGHGITTIEDLENDEQVWPVFLELTQDIGHKLRVHKKCADGVAIHIRDNTLFSKQWQTALDNYVVDSEAGGYSVIQVLCHELYHRYQHYQVNLLQAIRDNSDTAKYANLLLLDTAGIYEDEYINYISPDDDSAISYYMYNSQRLERDAEKYSNASVVDYYEQICSYLESN